MAKRIEELTIKSFRGATTPLNIKFENSKPMVMIFGENGTGKSTIVDAIDFICNNKYGSIEEKSSVKKTKHCPSIGDTKNDIEISICFNKNNYTATHYGKAPETTPDGFPSANILRRSKIDSLINKPASERFKTLKEFLTLPNIEKCENNLKEAVKNQQNKFNVKTDFLSQAKDNLEALKDKIVENEKPVQEIKEIDPEKNQQTIDNLNGIERLYENFKSLKASLENAELDLQNKIDNEKKALYKYELLQNNQSNHQKDMLKLLESAKHFLEKNSDINTCPVCNNPIIQKELIKNLSKRLSEMSELNQLLSICNQATKDKESSQSIVETRKVDFNKNKDELDKSIKNFVNNKTCESLDYDQFVSEIKSSDKVQNAKNELEKYNSFMNKLKVYKQLTEKNQRLKKEIQKVQNEISLKEQEAKKDEAILKRLKYYLQIVGDKRKKYVDDILYKVSNEIDRLYSKIHPNENVGGFKLFLNHKYKGSLEFDGDIHNIKTIPQAYLSESHLDTLGVCVFLALAKYFNDDNTIIVLDDVLTSVDEVHRERFINMLHDEAENFCQVIVTTHYGLWRDYYRISGGPQSKVDIIDLQLWTQNVGIRHSKSRPMIEELESLKDDIKVDNRDTISSKSGIILEWLLDKMALQYKLKLPRQLLPKYELGVLFDSIHKKSKNIKIIQGENEAEIGDLIQSLKNMSWIRNQIGCHFNLDENLSISDATIKEFADKTIELCQIIICQKCGNLAKKPIKSENCYQCKCGNSKMYPLQI